MKGTRLLSELMLLQAHGRLSCRELAERLEISERTAHRDMEALSAAGIPVFALRGAQGGWELAKGWRTKVPGLDEAELRGLLMAQPSALGDPRLVAAAERAFGKLMAALPGSMREQAESMRARLHVDPSGWRPSSENLSMLPIVQIVSENRPRSENWPGLILEITEDQIVRDIAVAQRVAPELKACGVSIAIDDFGAGYSSFSSLRAVPFAELKVDTSFVKNCATDANNAAICQTAIDLAHRFGSVAVAEGIESMTDLQALVVMGCDFGQGMLVAPPMTRERFLELLRQRSKRPAQPQAAATGMAAAAAG